MKKAISLLLVLIMCYSLCMTVFATNEPVDSIGSVTGDIDKTLPEEMTGQDTNQSAASQYGEFGAAGDEEVEVYVTKASTYTVTIPKVVILSGATNTATGAYAVRVQGDISGTEYIKVVPEATFALEQAGKTAITATVDQDKVKWAYSNLSVDGTGTIEATGLSAGSWHGSFQFNISRGENQTTLEGDGQTFHRMAPSALSFRSNAPIDEFQEVKINGETLDPAAYTLTEGSTIVTLNIDYLETLDIDNYEITVVSDNGSPSADFGVVTTNVNEYGFYYNQPYTAYVEAVESNVAFLLKENYEVVIFAYVDASIGLISGQMEMTENGFIVTTQDFGVFEFVTTDDKNEIYCAGLDCCFVLDNQNIAADNDYVYVYSENLGGYSVTTIDKTKAIYGIMNTNINGKQLMHISSSMFENNQKLTTLPQFPEVWMLNNYTGYAWGECLFEGCSNLTTAIIPNIFTCLPYGCFRNCTSLTTVVIPATVTSAGWYVFDNCTSLTTIIFEGTIEQWDSIYEFKYHQETDTFKNVPATYVQCSDGIVPLV